MEGIIMKRFTIVLIATLIASAAHAETSAQFTLPGLRAPDDPDVTAFRFSLLHGTANSVSGLDLGLFSFSETKDFSGFSFIMGIAHVTGESDGCLCSLVNIHEGKARGINVAFINSAKDVSEGGNVGFVNITDGPTAWEVGGLSMSDSANVQVGFVNITERIDKLQIGFLNMADNGFFKVFPFFNYPKKE
jgi:hypothetical protein